VVAAGDRSDVLVTSEERKGTILAIPASHHDLLDGQLATLATVGSDGQPQMPEVWFLADGDTLSLSLNTAR
jgi:L-aminopeptidase/D-esterase-like protein